MTYPKKALSDLEWPRLLEHLAARCAGEEAADSCRKLPFLQPEEIPKRLALIEELMTCISEGDPPPALPVRPVGEWLARIRGEGSVPAEALRDTAVNLKLYTTISRFLENRRDVCPRNAALVNPEDGSVSPLGLARLAAEIDMSFEPDGQISDRASPDLGPLRRQVVSLRRRLVLKIEKIAEQQEDVLQERTVTIRNDRFVLPVRADAHRRLSGLVHGASGSGATVFIEPEAAIETGNDLMLAREEVAREETRILQNLCEAVRDQLDEVSVAYRLAVEADVRIASARLSNDLEASAPHPASAGEIRLKRARHPLLVLDGVDVVPSNVDGSAGTSVVISGPNAGGKTVVLKTIGILELMLAAGLPIPADPDSHLAVPRAVLTDIGDDQSLERNLSTFSAHMTNIASILETAGHGSIVILDELAAGTDPSEGSALAEAFLERLNSLDATVFATTHFDELKSRAQEGDGFTNAAVGFDMQGMRPTFELRQGIPGSSSALAVARRFGAPGDVIERAREILPGGVRDLTNAVEALEEERRLVMLERQAMTEARQAAEKSQRRRDDEISRLRDKQKKFIDKEAEELWSSIRKAREKVRDAEVSIRRRRNDASTITRSRKVINAVAEDLDPGGKLNPDDENKPPGRPAMPEDIAAGAAVYVRSFRASGIIESELKGGRVYVRIGKVRTNVKLKDLLITEAGHDGKQKPTKTRKRPRLPKSISHSMGTPDALDPAAPKQALRTSDTTVDLRGMTVDEAVDATDAFLDRALKEDWPAVFILHGHGTGALRGAIRDYLAESQYIEEFRPGERNEGGDGITVAWLR
ncbi:MAG: endonuclease MutS2 [Deltaproteobacteria bacterium]|nr:endonuclease MutS2 [Deltaproteobacteria bacterium]